MTSNYNRFESHAEDYSGNYSRAGMDDDGDLTSRFLDEIKAELPDPVAVVHSDRSGLKFFGFCSTHKFWGTKRSAHATAWRDAERHNLRYHND